MTPERIAEAPDMLHFEKGIYCAFIESGVLQGDVATYKTNFGVTLTSRVTVEHSPASWAISGVT